MEYNEQIGNVTAFFGAKAPLYFTYFIPTYSFCSYPPFMALNGL